LSLSIVWYTEWLLGVSMIPLPPLAVMDVSSFAD
jgi:hypothetical protein